MSEADKRFYDHWFEDNAPDCADGITVLDTSVVYFVSGLVVVTIQLFIIAMLKRGRYLASKGDKVASTYLVLPIYYVIVRYLVLIGIVTALLDMSAIGDGAFAISLKWGLYRICSESVAVFFMHNGIGIHTLLKSVAIGVTWGSFSTIVPFVVFNLYGWRSFLAVSTCFNVLLLTFYMLLWLAPRALIHRRPALLPFARYYAVGLILFLLMHSLLLVEAERFPCLTESITLFADIFQPLVIYYALLQDSRFWQGLYVSEEESGYTAINEPLLGMWELGRDTISAVADTILSLEKQVVPIIPFGNLKIDSSSYFSGGTARVYKGTFGQTQVAIKTLFCIELTPEKVVEFCEEAGLLNALKHDNILHCYGVAVMPPAICLVTEWCIHGSLFDMLHESDFFIRDSSVGRLSMASIYGIENSLAAHLLDEEEKEENRSSHSSYQIGNTTPFDDELRVGNDIESCKSLASVVSNQEEESEFGSYNLAALVDEKAGNATRSHSMHTTSTSSRTNSANNDSSYGTHSNTDSFVRESQSSIRRRKPAKVNVVLNADNGEVSELGEDLIRKLHRSTSKGGSLHALTKSNVENLKSAATVMQSKRMGYGLGPTDGKNVPPSTSYASRSVMSDKDNSVGPLLVNGGGSSRNTLGMCLPLGLRYRMIRDCCAGVAHLHSKGMMHCDVKSLNFLVSSDFVIKLADLGESRPFRASMPPEESKLMPKNINWTAPEVLVANGESVCEKADVWSLAVVCSEILSGEIPFDSVQCRRMSMESFVGAIANNLRPPLPNNINPRLRSAIHTAWSYGVQSRISAKELHEIFDEYLKEKLNLNTKSSSESSEKCDGDDFDHIVTNVMCSGGHNVDDKQDLNSHVSARDSSYTGDSDIVDDNAV